MKSLPNPSIENKRVEVLWLTWEVGLVDLTLSAPGKPTCPKSQNPAITQITIFQSPREMLSSGTSTAALKHYKRAGGVPLGGTVTCVWTCKPAGVVGGRDRCPLCRGALVLPSCSLSTPRRAPGGEKVLGRSRGCQRPERA